MIESSVSIPVFRPLLGFNKEETVRIAKRIGTYEASSSIEEFCSLESHSNASPDQGTVMEQENKLNFDIKKLASSVREAKESTDTDFKPDSTEGLVVVKWEGTPKPEKGKGYLFVCKRGNTAAEVAREFRQKGFRAFALSEKEARKRGVLK